MEKINRNTILKEMRDMAWHNVYCLSDNYGMTRPKDGKRDEWEQAIAKAKIIDQMCDELPGHSEYIEEISSWTHYRIFVGSIAATNVGTTRTKDAHKYIEAVEIDIAGIGDGHSERDSRIFRIEHQLGIDFLLSGQYDKERHARYAAGKCDTIKVTVDSLNSIQQIEWVD